MESVTSIFIWSSLVRDYLTVCLFVVAVTSVSGTAIAGIYKYLDENGNIAYTDKPVQGAEKLKIKLRPTPEADPAQRTAEALESDDDGKEVTRYESLELLTPNNDKVVSDRSGSVQVILLPTPRLSIAHEMVITVDGKDISRGQHANLNLSQVARGTHTVSARILDAHGYTMISSPTNTFHVQRP